MGKLITWITWELQIITTTEQYNFGYHLCDMLFLCLDVYDDVITWKCFPHCWPLVKRIHPWKQSSWGQHGAHLGPTGPRWAPCWPNEPCYLGSFTRGSPHEVPVMHSFDVLFAVSLIMLLNQQSVWWWYETLILMGAVIMISDEASRVTQDFDPLASPDLYLLVWPVYGSDVKGCCLI